MPETEEVRVTINGVTTGGPTAVGQWLRMRPSGNVHFINGREDRPPRLRTLCGVWKHRARFTYDYPPLSRHCQRCADLRGPKGMPLGVPVQPRRTVSA